MDEYEVGQVVEFDDGTKWKYLGGDPTKKSSWEEARGPVTARQLGGALLNGLTFSWGPELQGKVATMTPGAFGYPSAAERALPPEQRDSVRAERADREMEVRGRATQDLRELRRDHPVVAFGAEALGGILGAAPAALMAPEALGGGLLARLAASSAATGAVSGAIAGAGESDESRGLGAGVGAVVGGGLGLASNVAGRFLRGPATRAASRLANAIGIGGEAEIARRATAGLPEERLVDLNPRTQSLGETVGTYPGEHPERFRQVLEERQGGMSDRVGAELQRGTGIARENAVVTQEQLRQRAYDASRPLYAAAERESVPAGVLAQHRNVPEFQRAYELGRGLARVEDDVDLPAWDALEMTDQLPVRVIDAVKKGMDEYIETGMRQGTVSRARARALRERLRSMLTTVDELVPVYGQAREAFAGNAALEAAFREGREEFMNADPRAIRARLAEMTASERAHYRRGAQDALMLRMDATGDNRNVVGAVFGNRLARQRVEALYAEPANARRFVGEILPHEQNMNTSFVLANRGSPTARRLAGQASLEEARPSQVLDALAHPVRSGSRAVGRALDRMSTGEAAAAELAQALQRPMSDPAVQELVRRAAEEEARRRAWMTGGVVFGSSAAARGLLD